jgi:hypothetical protein
MATHASAQLNNKNPTSTLATVTAALSSSVLMSQKMSDIQKQVPTTPKAQAAPAHQPPTPSASPKKRCRMNAAPTILVVPVVSTWIEPPTIPFHNNRTTEMKRKASIPVYNRRGKKQMSQKPSDNEKEYVLQEYVPGIARRQGRFYSDLCQSGRESYLRKH